MKDMKSHRRVRTWMNKTNWCPMAPRRSASSEMDDRFLQGGTWSGKSKDKVRVRVRVSVSVSVSVTVSG